MSNRKARNLVTRGAPVTMGGASKAASFACTTTGAQTLTLQDVRVGTGESVTIDWGDGSSDTYTAGAGTRTHAYAGAGTWTVKVSNPAGVAGFDVRDNKVTLNSTDIKQMVNITSFRATTLKAGTFNSTDVSAWRPTNFNLYSMPAGYAGTFNSTDVSAWRPTNFQLSSMPAGYAGTFDSADVSAWRPTNFNLSSMPAGYAGTFDSADVSAWRLTTFYLYSMPTATFTITITAGGFAGWVTTTTFHMGGNGLSQAAVDQILADFWAGFATRTATAGTGNVGSTNAAPSGTLQAANPPTTGKEYAYELVNDSQNVNPTKKWTTWTITT
jgi:hypothetical protein